MLLPKWVTLTLIIAAGVLMGILAKEVGNTTSVWDWKTWAAAAVAFGIIPLASFLSAPGYNPLQKTAGLRMEIFTGAAIAAFTVLFLTAVS